jgi:hypothetical protein
MRPATLASIALLAAAPAAAQLRDCTQSAALEAHSEYHERSFVITREPVAQAKAAINACNGSNHFGINVRYMHSAAGATALVPAIEIGRVLGANASPADQMNVTIGVRDNRYYTHLHQQELYVHLGVQRAVFVINRELSTRDAGVHAGIIYTDTTRHAKGIPFQTHVGGGLADHYFSQSNDESDYYLAARIGIPKQHKRVTITPALGAQITVGAHLRRSIAASISATYR